MASIRGIVVILAGCLALALRMPPATAAAPAQGQDAFDEGQRSYLAGNYREALDWFKKGFLGTEDPGFLLNIAQCHRSLGETKEALMMYRLYLKSAPAGMNQDARAVAAKAVRELEGETAASAATPVPAGAAASVPASTDPVSGRASEQPLGSLPVLEPLPEAAVKQAPAAPAPPSDNRQSTVRHLSLAGMVCGGVGLVSVGAGLYYWSRASSLSDSANKALAYNPADYDQGKRAETMQWIFYGVGAVAVMSGVGLYVYSRWLPAKQANVSLAPLLGPGAAGLQAQGAF